jgi:GH25 family lysozyme M1 (1,4-beta-N-acetylmuramidase)
MAEWICGIDISKWQGKVDWQKVADSGVQFVYMRAFNGTRLDETLEVNAAGARKYGIPFGLYTYWRPKDAAGVQAQRLVDAHRKFGASLIPMLDVEHQDDKPASEIAQSVRDGVRFVEAELKCSPVIYTAAWFWNPKVGDARVGHCPLWLARYSTPNPAPTDVSTWGEFAMKCKQPAIPYGWSQWDAWQFSADGNFAGPAFGMSSSHLDLNILRGDVWSRFQVPSGEPAAPPPANLSRSFEMKMVVPPVRVYDSRHAGAHGAHETRRIRVADADAAFVNVTVVNPSRDGYVTVWGKGDMPNVSNVNHQQGTVCNTSWVPLDGGFINVFTSQNCHLLIDLQAVAE